MGIADRRRREKQQRRNDILDAAEEVFFSKGSNLATMDEVAEQAELSKGTLYLYFQSKEELYLGISCRALTLLRDMFEKAVIKHSTGIDQIFAIAEAYYNYSKRYSNYFNMIVHYEASKIENVDSESLAGQCHQLGQNVMQVVATAIENGIKDGTIRENLNSVETAYLLQGTSTGIIQLIAREKDHIEQYENFAAEELMENFREMMYDALKSYTPDSSGVKGK
jgi:AcrR family transcriptional regulator